ncbi:MAG: hypothetical protein OXR66_06580 [Candidatus Woesearchaeota archaeon]|nr:hypothetical protein [Candidatus Woesearchaeota archaeon]
MTHIKCIAAPKTWPIDRKAEKFVTRPRPRGLPLEQTLPLVVVLRDVLRVADTKAHVNKILKLHNVTVNGRRVHHADSPVGFMDVLGLGKDLYRVSLNKNNMLTVEPTKNQATLQKIRGKTTIAGGKTQLNCASGMNIIVEKDTYKTGDTVAVTNNKITAHYPLKEGATTLITGGSHIGSLGTIKKIEGDTLSVKTEENVQTTKRYAYVVEKAAL